MKSHLLKQLLCLKAIVFIGGVNASGKDDAVDQILNLLQEHPDHRVCILTLGPTIQELAAGSRQIQTVVDTGGLVDPHVVGPAFRPRLEHALSQEDWDVLIIVGVRSGPEWGYYVDLVESKVQAGIPAQFIFFDCEKEESARRTSFRRKIAATGQGQQRTDDHLAEHRWDVQMAERPGLEECFQGTLVKFTAFDTTPLSRSEKIEGFLELILEGNDSANRIVVTHNFGHHSFDVSRPPHAKGRFVKVASFAGFSGKFPVAVAG